MTTKVLAVLLTAFGLVVMFRKSWTTTESDFSNYYTAAVLAVHGQPLRSFYDWTWFQREMNLVGYERQMGSYIPQTPVAMLPFMPLAKLPPQRAKQAWLLCNLGFLGIIVWLLARTTGFKAEQITVLTFAGFGSLYSNFFYGQYYVFVLLLLTLAFFCLDHRKDRTSGFVAGLAFAFKLYGGPLLLYFAVKGKWRAAAGLVATTIGAVIVAIVMFSWNDVVFYGTQILPRALNGEVIDPYNSAIATLTTLLRRLFVGEPELNPQPLWNAPLAFFFLQPLVSLLILGATLLGLTGERVGFERRDFAWFLVATMVLSANTASYTFILLLLPIALLLVDAGLGERVFLVLAFFGLCFPLRASWTWAFPKLWLLLAVYLVIGWPYLRSIRPKLWIYLAAGCTLVAAASAYRREIRFAAEPGQRWERVAVEKGAMFSSSPAVSRAGLFFHSIGDDRYILRWLHDGKIEKLTFEGHAVLPSAPSPDGPIYFELVAHGASTKMEFDPVSRRMSPISLSAPSPTGSAPSPDGRWLAFESTGNGPKQIWVRNTANGSEQRLTGGNYNSWAPAWELDSKAILFSSDCGRGIGLPSLYRARVEAR